MDPWSFVSVTTIINMNVSDQAFQRGDGFSEAISQRSLGKKDREIN